MPGFDGRGPNDRGPMTGRRFGRCGAAPTPATKDTNDKRMLPDQESIQPAPEQQAFYGLGQGGIPCGCGRGFGGGRFRSAYNRQGTQR